MELAVKLCTTDTHERMGNRQRLQRIKQSDYAKLQHVMRRGIELVPGTIA